VRGFEDVFAQRLAVPNQRAFCRGAAEVERQNVLLAKLAAKARGHQHTGRGAGFQQPNRVAARRIRKHQPATRTDHPKTPGKSEALEAIIEPRQITVDKRLRIGVRAGRHPANRTHA